MKVYGGVEAQLHAYYSPISKSDSLEKQSTGSGWLILSKFFPPPYVMWEFLIEKKNYNVF